MDIGFRGKFRVSGYIFVDLGFAFVLICWPDRQARPVLDEFRVHRNNGESNDQMEKNMGK